MIWGVQAYGYFHDRVSEAEADTLDSSLMLVRLGHPQVIVKQWPDNLAVSLDFRYAGKRYRLKVTAPDFEQRFRTRGEGIYSLASESYACISLGEPYQGHRHKLAAAVFEVE